VQQRLLLELVRAGKLEEAGAIAGGFQQQPFLTSLLTASDGSGGHSAGHGGLFWAQPLALPGTTPQPTGEEGAEGAVVVTICTTVEHLLAMREVLNEQLGAVGTCAQTPVVVKDLSSTTPCPPPPPGMALYLTVPVSPHPHPPFLAMAGPEGVIPLGVDAEWRPQKSPSAPVWPCSVLQLASRRHVWLVDLLELHSAASLSTDPLVVHRALEASVQWALTW
jgi:hypothetical protein